MRVDWGSGVLTTISRDATTHTRQGTRRKRARRADAC